MTTNQQQPEPSTALVAPTDNEIEQIRRRGAMEIAHRKEVDKLEKQIAGLTWGAGSSMAVAGSSLSPMTRAVMAEFCVLVRANPMYHVDILGGKPYLNAVYWSDLINSRPNFHHYEQRDLSPSVEKALRERAARHRTVAEELLTGDEAAQRRARALDLEDEADDIALARAQWSAPAWAQVVIQTTIYRFIDAAPLEAIRGGVVTDIDRYLIPVYECNWAGGRPRQEKRGGGTYDPDPIGNAEPAKTARTRSLRRAATKSFSAWMQQYEQQIAKAEEAIEAEYEIIRSERRTERAQLPAPAGAQAVRAGNGEPSASAANGAKPLPVEGEPAPDPQPEPLPPAAFDANDARKALFATWRDAGVEDRVKWSADNGLPESTKQWTPEQFARAMDLLLEPQRKRLAAGARIAGVDPEELARTTFAKSVTALTYREVRELVAHVNALADAEEVAQ